MTGFPLRSARVRAANVARLRRPVQALAFAAFATLAIAAAIAPTVARWLFAFDPLTALAAMLASRQASVTLLIGSGASLIVALVLGRAWCGWLCPLGAILDWMPARKPRPKEPDLAPSWRHIKYVLLVMILGLALVGNLSLVFLDPLTLMVRTIATAAWPAFNVLLSVIEQVAYTLPFLQAPVDALEAARGGLLPIIQPLYPAGVLVALLFASVLALNAIRPRFWCRYLCPLGGLLGLVSRLAFIRREPSLSCNSCTRCSRGCPMGAIDASNAFRSNPAECTVCLECAEDCPRDGQTFPGHVSFARHQPEDPGRRHFLLAVSGAIVTFGVLRLEPGRAWGAEHVHPYLIRPPGALDPRFASQCIRCGLCLRSCPTSGLQPGLAASGWTAAWTPVLVPRLGHCDYNCTACGQVCPTGAIPALDLATKRQIVIGQAYIDQDRCIPWADGRNCLVCEEMCPLPDKAIKLEDVTVTGTNGATAEVRRPRVVREHCIGCGICENRCPLPGEAAIRVLAPA